MNTEQELEIVESMFPHTDECRTNIKEAKKLNLTSNCMCNPLLKEKRIKLVSLINKHYVRKEDVKGLKMEHQPMEYFFMVEANHFGEAIKGGYDKAVSEINAKIDSLIKDKEGE